MMKLIVFVVAISTLSFSVFAEQIEDDTLKKSYIIKFSDEYEGNPFAAKSNLRQYYSGRYKKTFNRLFSGVVADLTEQEFKKLKTLAFVEKIETDSIVKPAFKLGKG